jgi:hypothetical protein
MPIASRFRHDLVILRRAAGSADARGDVADTFTPQDPIKGRLHPHVSSELRGVEPEGVARADGWAFLPIDTAIAAADRIQDVTASAEGPVYEVVGIPRDAAGRGRHLELDVLLVTP